MSRSNYWYNVANAAVAGANIYAIFLAALGLWQPGLGILFNFFALFLCGAVVIANAPKGE